MALPASQITASAALALFGAAEADVNNELDLIYKSISGTADTAKTFLYTLADATTKQAVLTQLATDGYAVTVQPDGKLLIDWTDGGIIP